MKHGFRYLWRILVILLVNVLIIALAGNFGGSVQTLSKVGSTGEEVRQIQTKLKEYGVYTGEVDGIYGTQTKNAVIAFQKYNGLAGNRRCASWGSPPAPGRAGSAAVMWTCWPRLFPRKAAGSPTRGRWRSGR